MRKNPTYTALLGPTRLLISEKSATYEIIWSYTIIWQVRVLAFTAHRGFLEHGNGQKSVCNIWQHFLCLLDEGIPKIWKKLNSHGGFLRADQGRAKMCCRMGWIGCSSKSHRENSISFIFLDPPHQVDIKNVVKSSKHFWVFQYFRNSLYINEK